MQHVIESRMFEVEESKLRELVELPADWTVQHPETLLRWPGGQQPGVPGIRVVRIRFERYV